MTKKNIISELKNNSFENGIAEIRCDVFYRNKIFNNASILVFVNKHNAECFEDQILDSKHWEIFTSIGDFIKNTVIFCVANSSKLFDSSKIVIKNFLSVKSFASDFEPKDINGDKLSVGDKVIWYDPEEKCRQLDRIYTISKINGYHNDDIILLTDEISEVETIASEIEKVKK